MHTHLKTREQVVRKKKRVKTKHSQRLLISKVYTWRKKFDIEALTQEVDSFFVQA